MRRQLSCALIGILFLTQIECRKSDPLQNRLEFDQEFFQTYVQEMPDSRLLKKSDLPLYQQGFFDEFNAQLQLLADLNQNNIPEYFVAGICQQCIENNIKMPYFIAIFERQESGVKRLFFQRVFVPPVNIYLVNGEPHSSVVISFAFATDYGAEIYYDNEEYHLEQW